jgi:outer membrane protein assembly factor BamB
VALDKRTGKERWRVDRDEVTSWSTPIVVEYNGRPQVIVNATDRTRGYDLKTGEGIWECGGMTVNTVPSPVAGGGMVYVTSGFRDYVLQAIRLDRAKGDITGSDAVAWTYDRDTPYVPSPLLYGDKIYFLKNRSGILSCLNAKTGEVYYTRQRLEGISGTYASPVGVGGRVYLVGRNGTSVVIRHGDRFEVLAKNVLADRFEASPAVVGDELYLRGNRYLYCIAAD